MMFVVEDIVPFQVAYHVASNDKLEYLAALAGPANLLHVYKLFFL